MDVVKRLLWKEVIRSWPLVALVAALPTYAFGWWLPKLRYPIHGIFGYGSYDYLLIAVTLGILLLAVVAWSAVTGAGERFRQSYASIHFPIPATLTPVIGFGVQLLLGAAVGFSAGHWFIREGLLVPIAIILFYTVAAGVSFMMTMTRLSSNAIGLIVFLIYGIVKFTQALPAGRYPPSLHTETGKEMVLYSLCALLALSIAMVIQALPGNLSRQARQTSSLVMLTAVLIGFPIAKPMLDGWLHRNSAPAYSNRLLTTPDGVLAVSFRTAFDKKAAFPKELPVDFTDFPRQWHGQMTFDGPVLPVGFIGHDAVILARQRPGERQITLLRWHRAADTTEQLFSFTTYRQALQRTMSDPSSWIDLIGCISPDGRYGLLALCSPYGDYAGNDIWLLDFTRQRATLVIPAIHLYGATVGWMADRAVMTTSSDTSYRIDLAAGTMAKTTIREER
ncbi:MAG: hypothetical protein ACYDCO_12490 [Armatimonadota bacterium]